MVGWPWCSAGQKLNGMVLSKQSSYGLFSDKLLVLIFKINKYVNINNVGLDMVEIKYKINKHNKDFVISKLINCVYFFIIIILENN